MDFDRTLCGVYRTRELDQDAIARGFDDDAVVLGDAGIEYLLAVRLELRQGPRLNYRSSRIIRL